MTNQTSSAPYPVGTIFSQKSKVKNVSIKAIHHNSYMMEGVNVPSSEVEVPFALVNEMISRGKIEIFLV